MAVSKDKIRLSVTLHKDVYNQLKRDAKKNGISISAEANNIINAYYKLLNEAANKK